LLVCGYTRIANPGSAVAQTVNSRITVPLAAEVPDPDGGDRDPEYRRKREEYLRHFLGIAAGSQSPEAYIRGQAAARALPPSPLLQGGSFMSPQGELPSLFWTWPIVPPIGNSYGGDASAIIYTLGLDPTDPNTVYTGSFSGLAMTTDGGIHWSYLSDGWSSQAVSSIVVNPRTPSVVYVGTGSDYPPYCVGLYRSEQGEWTNLGLAEFGGTAIRKVAIDENTLWDKHPILYVTNGRSVNSGLWRSVNSGSTWTRIRQGPPSSVWNGIYDVVVDHSTDPSTLYITQDDGTFKSVDSGEHWTLIHTALAGAPNQLLKVNSTLYLSSAGDPAHNLYKSSDAGANWTQIPTNCFTGADTCANNNYLGLWVFAVDPANPNIILGGNQALYRTTNEGATWTEIGHWWGPDIHTDHRTLAFSTADPSVVYDGNDGGIVKSTNAGETWTNLNQNLPGALLYSVGLSQDNSMIAGTQDNGVIFSDLGGPWHMIFGGDSGKDLINPTNSSQSYWVIYEPNKFHRYNRLTGENFNISPTQLINDPACFFFPAFNINPSSPTHLVAACQHVVRTLNGTLSPPVWQSIGQPFVTGGYVVTAACEAPSDSNVIYAVEGAWPAGWRVWITTNANDGAGAIWNDRTGTVPGGIRRITVHPSDPQTAYLACDSGVYKTQNMGLNWTRQGPANITYSEVAIDPVRTQHVFAASSAGVLASTDGGVNWENMSAGIPAGMFVTGVSFNVASCRLAVSTYGRGVYWADLDCVPPAVSITAPANGALVRGTVTVSATASDNASIAGVQFKLDGAALGAEDTIAPYSVNWNTVLTFGNHTLTAVARDTSDNITTSAPVTVTVDNVAPTVSITQPANGATVSETVVVSATASDNVGVVGVQFKLDGANLSDEDTTVPYAIKWDTAFQSGSHTLTAVARDGAGNAVTSTEVTVQVIEPW